MILDIIIVIIGISVVLAGADRLTEGASALARRLHVSEIVIGLTIVALVRRHPNSLSVWYRH